jgi:signal peptidase II
MTDDPSPQAEAPADPAGEPSRAGEGRAAPATPLHRHPGYAFLAIVSLVTLAADLGTKGWAEARLEAARPFAGRTVELIKGHVYLTLAQNPGGAWGILQDESASVRKPFFVLISIAAVVFIVSLYRKLEPRQWALKWGLPLVLGGAIGNLVDRIRYGHVIDFIRVRVTETFTWPTFNVADIAIVVGVGLMAIDMFTPRNKQPGPLHAAEPAASGAEPSAPAERRAPGDEG